MSLSHQDETSPNLIFWGNSDAVRVVSKTEAFRAAEQGNSVDLAAYLHIGGNPHESQKSYTLLHVACGCSYLKTAIETTYVRAPPETEEGFATCVSLLIAAGADPNSKAEGGCRPLDGACLVADAECCRLLLQAGARNFRSLTLPIPLEEIRLLPRSPLHVKAKLLDAVDKNEERDRDVEVRWIIPQQVVGCGEIQRYVVRSYSNGRLGEVVHSAAGPGRGNRRDFCDNNVVDRGIALRRNLGLGQPESSSTLLHGLMPGVTYHFAVSAIAELEGKVRESPPSLMSKPLEIPAVEEEEWNMGEILDKVFAHGLQTHANPPQSVLEATQALAPTPPPLPVTPPPLPPPSPTTSVDRSERAAVVAKSYWEESEDDHRGEEEKAAARQRQREHQREYEEKAAEKLRAEQILQEMRGKGRPPSQVNSGDNGGEDCAIS